MRIGLKKTDTAENSVPQAARRDIVAAGVIVASILLLLGTVSKLASSAITSFESFGGDSDQLLMIAVALNVALSLFSWRRYRDSLRHSEFRAEAEERVQTLTSFDTTTSLHNRKSFAEKGAELLSKTLRRQRSVALLAFDLDHFKNVNDVHGHGVGDDLLRSIAADLHIVLPPNSITGRLGGDEFGCAFVFDPVNPEVVERIAEDILSLLAQPRTVQGILLANLSVSIGIASNALDCTTIEAMLRRADIAMFAAKHKGRNCFTWFDAAMERELLRRNGLEAAMREGIARGDFEPYFEQQIDVASGKLSGFEMLARWHHPTKGLIMPEEFIPIAEETGMIGDLSMMLLRRSFEEAKNWDPKLMLSVNISPMQLRDPWFAQKLVKLLVETGFPASRLEIEITETSLYENLSLAQSIIGSLKNQGIQLALDDFGTGYSSLSNLRALPFDRIKIDRSFVTSINENAESAAIVNAIARLGDSLGLPVTAEGIEDERIADRLREIGCHKAQGWLFGQPTSVAQTRTLLAEQNMLAASRGSGAEAVMPVSPPVEEPTITAVQPPAPVRPVSKIDDAALAAFERPAPSVETDVPFVVRKAG